MNDESNKPMSDGGASLASHDAGRDLEDRQSARRKRARRKRTLCSQTGKQNRSISENIGIVRKSYLTVFPRELTIRAEYLKLSSWSHSLQNAPT